MSVLCLINKSVFLTVLRVDLKPVLLHRHKFLVFGRGDLLMIPLVRPAKGRNVGDTFVHATGRNHITNQFQHAHGIERKRAIAI